MDVHILAARAALVVARGPKKEAKAEIRRLKRQATEARRCGDRNQANAMLALIEAIHSARSCAEQRAMTPVVTTAGRHVVTWDKAMQEFESGTGPLSSARKFQRRTS